MHLLHSALGADAVNAERILEYCFRIGSGKDLEKKEFSESISQAKRIVKILTRYCEVPGAVDAAMSLYETVKTCSGKEDSRHATAAAEFAFSGNEFNLLCRKFPPPNEGTQLSDRDAALKEYDLISQLHELVSVKIEIQKALDSISRERP